MSTVKEIEAAIRNLPEGDLAAFRAWFAEFDAVKWDEQFERDVLEGRLDAFVESALLAEPALAVDWSRPEEDAAWSHLQPAKSS